MKYISFLYLIIFPYVVNAQKFVAITMDDVPNVNTYQSSGNKSILLHKIDSMQLPISVFINEGLLYKTKQVDENFGLLNEWIKSDHVTLGTHTFGHSHYSEVGIDSFRMDIKKGTCITKELAQLQNKSVEYFRFPYNDMGADSVQHMQARAYLSSENLISTPFTVESSDWMFNAIYEYYIKVDSVFKARETGEAYVNATITNFEWMDSLTMVQYGRRVNHIYLCHDNTINAAFLPEIIKKLTNDGYQLISLKEALQDKMYSQDDTYYKKWGISWVYRWMKDSKERRVTMQKEPDVMEYYRLYEKISSGEHY